MTSEAEVSISFGRVYTCTYDGINCGADEHGVANFDCMVTSWVAIDHRWCVSMNRAGGGAVQALAARECKASV